MESNLLGHLSGKRDPIIKWKKKMFRSVVVACAAVSTACAGDLDKFVALIGLFASGLPVYTSRVPALQGRCNLQDRQHWRSRHNDAELVLHGLFDSHHA